MMFMQRDELLSGFDLPDPHAAVIRGRRNTVIFRVERSGPYHPTVACQLLVQPSRLHVPHAAVVVCATRCEILTVVREDHEGDHRIVTLQNAQALVRLSIPDADGHIVRARRKLAAVRGPDNVMYRLPMTLECRKEFAAIDIPQHDVAFAAG